MARHPEPDSERLAGADKLGLRAPAIDAVRPEKSQDVLLRDLLAALYRRRWMIGLILATFAATAAVYNEYATPVYEARARLLIGTNPSRVVTFRPVIEDELANAEYYATQYEVLRSRALAAKAISRMDRSSSRQGATSSQSAYQAQVPLNRIDALLGGILVSPIKGTGIVDVKYRSTDAAYAAQAANAMADAYIADKLDARLQASREASGWLNERLEELRHQVDASQRTLQNYRERKDAVSLDDRQNIIVQKLAQINTTVTTARTERITKESLYEQLRKIQESGASLDTFTPILSNATVQRWKGELADLHRDRALLAQQLGELHPDMIRVNTAIANAERRLQEETEKVVAGIRNDFLSAQANEQALMAALESQKHEVLDLNRKSIEYGALQREAGSTQQIFESVLQRVKEADLSGELQTSNARILDRAEVPGWPVLPKPYFNLVIACFAGLVVAVGLTFALEHYRPQIKTPDDILEAVGLPVLGITPRMTKAEALLEGPAVDALPPAFREALRGIRARILLSPSTADVRALAVSSTSAGEGKTLIASNLAVSMALTGRRVLLIDADMRRPRLHRLFELPRAPGLSDVVANGVQVSAAIRESSIKGLFVLPAGTALPSPSDALETERFRFLIRELAGIFDRVVLDCPPVMAVADAAIIANAATAALFVIGAGVTSREVVQAAIERLVSAQAHVVGVVLNNADAGSQLDSSYYYQDEPIQDPDAESGLAQPTQAITID